MPEVPKHHIDSSVKWSDEIKYDGGLLVVEAESFRSYINEFMKPFGDVPECSSKGNFGIPVGEMSFCVRTLPTYEFRSPHYFAWSLGEPRWTRTYLSMSKRDRKMGHVTFTAPIGIPVLHKNGDTWMSITPSELLSQRTAFRHARGHVLIGGMGMGWLARKVIALPKVKSVTVVEKDKGIAEFFSSSVSMSAPAGKRVNVVVEDAYEFASRKLQGFNSILFDIWIGYGHARYDRKWLELKQKAREQKISAWAWD